MANNKRTLVASRPAAMVLALTLVASLSAPFVILPRAHAQATPLPCTENNANGCTELSPTPPEDTVSVPPNIMLMLDDSGSMTWDVMPDYGYLADTSPAGLVNSNVNGVYYNPDTPLPYSPPPKADGTLYPESSFAAAPISGFDSGSATVDLSLYRGGYDTADASYEGTPVPYSISVAKVNASSYDPSDSCTWGGSESGTYPGYCYYTYKPSIPFNFYDLNNGDYYVSRCDNISDVYDYNGSLYRDKCHPGISFFTYTTGSPGNYTRYYVAKKAGDCAAAGLSSSVCFESDEVRQNVANWFSYYHTRILMAKSALMTAFVDVDPTYRLGFGSINGGNNGQLPSPTGTYGSNKVAQVQPFGDGSSGSQKAKFWNWVATLTPPHQSTPLRRSLQALGKYYQSSQPWITMSSDPGYTSGSNAEFACRASYAILTTDGFWNGGSPNVGNVDGANGPVYTPPAGDASQYPVHGYVAGAPWKDNRSNTLADVAMYYWMTDLRSTLANEVAPSKADPAFWQHMTTFTMGMGYSPTGIDGTAPNGDSPPTIQDILNWAQDGGSTNPDSAFAISGFDWPNPGGDSINNIADMAHAAINGHGAFFSAKNPQDLAASFANVLNDIAARNVAPTTAAVNASVLTAGTLSFSTGYNTGDWSGQFHAVTLKDDGSVDTTVWQAETMLDAACHKTGGCGNRKVYTLSYDSTATPDVKRFLFNTANVQQLDGVETSGLMSPASVGANDTASKRIQYLLGDSSGEGTLYRSRTSLLGAIIRSQPAYVSYPNSGYYNRWPNLPNGDTAPEAGSGAETYDAFVADNADRAGVAYLGANDGMLHAFAAPAPVCSTPTNCNYGNGGTELWAFIPRAVYANLGNLTSASNFAYRPTVDESPVFRDVFFSADAKWHTILAGGVGLGGRGVYALDITDPDSFDASDVLWEFDSDMKVDSSCVSNIGDCKGTDLGYTLSRPNIGRLANGKWVVIVANGYFPDCGTPDTPTNDVANCKAIAAQAPKDADGKPYSALFVLDAETGKMIAELKTPQVSGVTSFGLATPVLGDYDNNQVDDVAFAGDARGNLWRFDLSSGDPDDWKVVLAYKGVDSSSVHDQQPITTQPRLFPDPASSRFIVVFGTGKFLGIGDNSDTTIQALYGVRDQGSSATSAMALEQSDLTQQYLHEAKAPATLPDGTPNPNAGADLRCVTGSTDNTCADTATPASQVPASGAGSGGWFIELQTTTSGGVVNDAGERVVVSPGAIFASNTVVFQTLITGAESSDPCSPSTQGSILALNATTGGPAGVSSLGGWPMVGGRVNQARTSGSLPLVTAMGGGQAYLPGMTLAPAGSVISIDAPIWRRRSWNQINQNQ